MQRKKYAILIVLLTLLATTSLFTACDNNANNAIAPSVTVELNDNANETINNTSNSATTQTEIDHSDSSNRVDDAEVEIDDGAESESPTEVTTPPKPSEPERQMDPTDESQANNSDSEANNTNNESEDQHNNKIDSSTTEELNYVEEKPTIVFTDVDEYVYSTASPVLNIRTGPGVEYDRISSVPQNTKLHRIAVGNNSWSKIEIDGVFAYVSSNYLSKDPVQVVQQSSTPTFETVAEEIARRGNIGRLTIPSVGLSVAIFHTTIFDASQSQPIVDREDSAAYMPDAVRCYGQIVIADHVHQGFSLIKLAIPGTTYAHVDFGTYVDTYICTNKFIGKNTGNDLVDLNGVSVEGKNSGGICMYTCNSDDTITITYWQPV